MPCAMNLFHDYSKRVYLFILQLFHFTLFLSLSLYILVSNQISPGVENNIQWSTSYEIARSVVNLNVSAAYAIPRIKATAILRSRHVMIDGYPAFRIMKEPLSKFSYS